MKFFLIMVLAVILSNVQVVHAPVLEASPTTELNLQDLTTWVCRYNVGPNVQLKGHNLTKCFNYALKVKSHMDHFGK